VFKKSLKGEYLASIVPYLAFFMDFTHTTNGLSAVVPPAGFQFVFTRSSLRTTHLRDWGL